MRARNLKTQLVAAVLATATLVPIANAQVSCEDQQKRRVAGTLIGGGVGAAIGGSVAGKGAKTEGAILGAILGGVIGNQAARSSDRGCVHAYGFYDTEGRWHANNVSRENARGFYGARGEWVDGPPQGRYESGEWRRVEGTGYYDSQGHWVPPGADGYYDTDNRWVTVSASAGRPLPPPPARYDDRNFDRHDVVGRINWTRTEIVDMRDDGDLRSRDARRLLTRLDDIYQQQMRMPHRYGRLEPRDEDYINDKLDQLMGDARRLSRS